MRQEKELSNRFVLERMPQIREKVFSAPDPVFAGLQFSILGNYLDFAALQGQVSLETLEDMLDILVLAWGASGDTVGMWASSGNTT